MLPDEPTERFLLEPVPLEFLPGSSSPPRRSPLTPVVQIFTVRPLNYPTGEITMSLWSVACGMTYRQIPQP
jgi:hypothetical protein